METSREIDGTVSIVFLVFLGSETEIVFRFCSPVSRVRVKSQTQAHRLVRRQPSTVSKPLPQARVFKNTLRKR